jgi:hypothetical protein
VQKANQFTAGGDIISEHLEDGMPPSAIWETIFGRGNLTADFFGEALRRITPSTSPTLLPTRVPDPDGRSGPGLNVVIVSVASGGGGLLLIVLVVIVFKHRRSKDSNLSRGMDAGYANSNGVLVTMDEADRIYTEDELESYTTDQFQFGDQVEDMDSINITPVGLNPAVGSSPVGIPLSRTTSVPMPNEDFNLTPDPSTTYGRNDASSEDSGGEDEFDDSGGEDEFDEGGIIISKGRDDLPSAYI